MRTGGLAELAREPGMPSVPSLRQMILSRRDFPVIRRGYSGVAYQLDLDAAAAFVRQHWRDGRNERKRRRLAAEPFQPTLFDSEGSDNDLTAR